MKTITKQSLDELIKNLETVEKPVKETYTRTEAIEVLKPIIKELKKRGFSLSDIAKVISEQSNKELRISSNELREICGTKKRQKNDVTPTQPLSTDNTDEEVSETAEGCTTSDDEVRIMPSSEIGKNDI